MKRRLRGGPPKDLPSDLCASCTPTEYSEVLIHPLAGRSRVLWVAELQGERQEKSAERDLTVQEALEEGLTVVEDLPERMSCVVSYSAIGGGNACIRPRKGETFRAFLKRLRQTGEAGEHFAKAASRAELESLGVVFPGEDDAEFGEQWLDG